MQKVISILFLAVLISAGCNNEDILSPAEQLAEDIQTIEQYLADNNINAQKTASGLHYNIEVEGAGIHPNLDQRVEVQYTGYFPDGTIFDQTGPNRTITFPLNGVIQGWQEGIQLLREGGSGKLLIPSELGYGRNPPPGIPSNAVLIFDVTLVDAF
ncbi:MAG: FKBP-type peptidyl-prolyl cis-trans isomerase [Bacteroidota bacterium]